MKIQNIDDIFLTALNLYAGILDPEDIRIEDDFELKIILKGAQWDGRIDYKIARFILSMQNSMFSIYNKTSPNKVSFRSSDAEIEKFKVKVTINKGSTELIVAFTEFLKVAKELPIEYISTPLIGFATLYGIFALKGSVNSYFEKAKEIARIEAEKDERIAAIEVQKKYADTLDNAFRAIAKNTAPPLDLAKSLHETDKIIINGRSLSKFEAINTYDNEEYVEEEIAVAPHPFKIDGRYQVKAAFMEKQEVQLNFKGAKNFKATTKNMPPNEKELLYRQFAEADILAIAPAIDLQVSVVVCDSSIVSADIERIGKPRPGSITIFEALQASEVDKNNGLHKNTQGNLFNMK